LSRADIHKKALKTRFLPFLLFKIVNKKGSWRIKEKNSCISSLIYSKFSRASTRALMSVRISCKNILRCLFKSTFYIFLYSSIFFWKSLRGTSLKSFKHWFLKFSFFNFFFFFFGNKNFLISRPFNNKKFLAQFQ